MGNPIEMLIANMLRGLESRSGGNPFAANLLNLARNKDGDALQQIAQNVAKEKGFNLDDVINTIKSRFHF